MEAWQRLVFHCRDCFSISMEVAFWQTLPQRPRTLSGRSSVLVIIKQDANPQPYNHHTTRLNSRSCLSTVHMCLFFNLLYVSAFRTWSEILVVIAGLVVVEGYERVDCDCVHPSISQASNNSASLCVCPGPPVVPVSASLLSQLILIYGLTLFPAGWLDT